MFVKFFFNFSVFRLVRTHLRSFLWLIMMERGGFHFSVAFYRIRIAVIQNEGFLQN